MSNLLLERSAQMGRHSLLPKEYQQVEYIESTGTQWIDTGVCLSRHSDFDMFYKNKSSGTTGNVGFGYYNANGLTFEEQAWSTGNILIFGTGANDGYGFPVGFYNHGIHHLELKGNTLFVDDAEYGHYERTPSTASPFSLLIGAWRETNGIIRSGNRGIVLGKISFSTDNQLLFHGVPCYKKLDGTVGMYDTVAKCFLSNQGSGVLIKGADVLS